MLGAIALIILGYIVVSYVFFLFPRLLHKPKLVTQMPVHISHRGGAGERIENTLRAFQNAVELGTDMLELDCHLTKDGEVVILHDGNLKRSTGVNVDVSEVNYDELPQYLPKLEVQFHPGHFSHAKSPSDRKILRLFDLFTSFPHTPMNIDIKVDDDRLINKVSNMVREFHREKFTIWGSFSAKTCAKLKAANPAVPCFFPLDSVLQLFTCYVFGLLPFMPITYEYLELPLVAASNYPESAAATGLNRIKMKVMLWLMDFLLCSPRLYRHLKARGVPVFFWVCNTEEDFSAAFRLGAQAVMTDYPSRLRSFLRSRQTRRQKSGETSTDTLCRNGNSIYDGARQLNKLFSPLSPLPIARAACRPPPPSGLTSNCSEWCVVGD